MNSYIKRIEYISNKFKSDHVGEYAAECAYFTILSFIPFIMFFLTLIQFTAIDKASIFYWIKEIFPPTMVDWILGIIEEVYAKSVGTISITVFVALWSSSTGFYHLSKGLRKIYETEDPKLTPIVRIEGILYTLIFVIAIIAFLIIMILGKRIHKFISSKVAAVGIVTGAILKVRLFFLIGVMFIVFLMIYKFVPRHKMKIRYQVIGAIFSSVMWYIISWGFSLYIDVFQGFSNTYGSLASIILIMMWVYVCMYIILIGAEINVLYYKKNLIKYLN